jgi:dipeptidase E
MSRRLLLISNSTMFGRGYLDHVEDALRHLLAPPAHVAFVPWAVHDRAGYAAKARARLAPLGFDVRSVDEGESVDAALNGADAVFVGGGNTFRLVDALQRSGLMPEIQHRVQQGMPYIGSSAGSIVACPTIQTTKDMPIVQPRSFGALGLVGFQISPHYLDPDSNSTHMGETQEERIGQFLEENDTPVVGLREGAYLTVAGPRVVLRGTAGARLFRRDSEPVEAQAGADLAPLLGGTS